MKTPIEGKDIRKGDLIRAEWGQEDAREYMATWDGNGYGGAQRHYLLHRPTLPVELPTAPTLGWATKRTGDITLLGSWSHETQISFIGQTVVGSCHWLSADVAAFTPAVAVPKAALNELRAAEHAARMSDEDGSARNYARKRAIDSFLAAVDEANSDRA